MQVSRVVQCLKVHHKMNCNRELRETHNGHFRATIIGQGLLLTKVMENYPNPPNWCLEWQIAISPIPTDIEMRFINLTIGFRKKLFKSCITRSGILSQMFRHCANVLWVPTWNDWLNVDPTLYFDFCQNMIIMIMTIVISCYMTVYPCISL